MTRPSTTIQPVVASPQIKVPAAKNVVAKIQPERRP